MKTSTLCALAFFALCCLAWPQQAQAQYCGGGVAYGTSIITYDNNSTNVYAYSATELDYCAGIYYDPYVEGYLYEGRLTEFLRDAVDSDYGSGYADIFPAEAFTSASAKPVTRYIIKTYHYVIAYYNQYSCFSSGCGYYWYDPWGYSFAGGDYGGGYSFWGYYNPGYYYRQYYYLGSTSVDLYTPYFCPGSSNDTGTRYFAPGGPTEGSFCELPPQQEYSVSIRGRKGVAVAQGTAPAGGLPHVNTMNLTATGKPEGGTYRWSTTSTRIRLINPNSAVVTVQAVSKSAAKDDVKVSLVYTAPGGVEVPAEWSLTVQQPTFMKFDAITLNRANPECSGGSSGWEKNVRWRVMDHLSPANPMDAGELPLTSTTNPYAGQGAGTFTGVLPTDRNAITNNGFWTHHYHWCSTRCGRGLADTVRAYQRYKVNGFTLPDIQVTFECRKITVQGDGTDQTPLRPRRRTVAQFAQDVWLGAFDRDTTDAERQQWTDRLTTAQAQGQSQLLSEARIFIREMFHSAEYINRARSDEDYLSDLYWTYLQRAPDEGGYNFWLGVLRDQNAQGMNGRENMLSAFDQSTEFANLINSLEAPAPPEPTCDPVQEQDCYYQGGTWDAGSCFCTLPPPYDPCWNGSYYTC